MIVKTFIFSLSIIFACSLSVKDKKQSKRLTKQEISKLKKDPTFYQEGIASYYHTRFHGQKTANGEIYDTMKLTAAHKELPFNSKIRVINIQTGRSTVVIINDRGPFSKNKIIDLSSEAAKKIGLKKSKGISRVLLFRTDDGD